MSKSRMFLFVSLVTILSVLLSGCATQQTIIERNQIIGESNAEGTYQEAQQVAEVENWKDEPNKIVNVYLINPTTGGLLIPPVQCMGVPNSSTESLEPNNGSPRSSISNGWLVPIDGIDTYTTEMTGKDGTYGDPVAFRYCMSVDGNYYDWPAYGVLYLVTSATYTFPDATIKRDWESELKIKAAEEVLNRGGCINYETLEEIPCK